MTRALGLVILLSCCAAYHGLQLTPRVNVHSQRLLSVARRNAGDFPCAEPLHERSLSRLQPPSIAAQPPAIVAKQVGKTIISSLAIPMLLSTLLGVEPAAAAKAVVKSVVSPDRTTLDTLRGQQLRGLPKWIRKLYRISRKFLSGPVKGSNGAGDSVLLQALVRSTVLITLGIALATVMLKWEYFSQTRRLKKEVQREMKYREDMFIDAVTDLMKKIEDPKVKPAIKEDLKKEIRDLDPKGEIQAFVKGRGPRPNLSIRITESMRKKADDKEKAAASSRVKQEQQRQRDEQIAAARRKAEEEEQARERKRLKLEADILRKQYPDQFAGRSSGGVTRAVSPTPDGSVAVPPHNANGRRSQVDFNDDRHGQRRTATRDEDDEEEESDDDNYVDEEDEDEDEEGEEEEDDKVVGAAATASRNEVLTRLNEVLMQFNRQQGREVVSARARQLLVDEFTRRLQQVDDPVRRQAILQRIEQRLDDVPYWVEYSQRLVEENDDNDSIDVDGDYDNDEEEDSDT